MKNSDADTSRERKTDVSMESMPPPKRTRTEKKTEKEAEIKAETEGVKEMNEQAAIAVAAAAAGRSAARGVSARKEMAGPIASVGGVREMSP